MSMAQVYMPQHQQHMSKIQIWTQKILTSPCLPHNLEAENQQTRAMTKMCSFLTVWQSPSFPSSSHPAGDCWMIDCDFLRGWLNKCAGLHKTL